MRTLSSSAGATLLLYETGFELAELCPRLALSIFQEVGAGWRYASALHGAASSWKSNLLKFILSLIKKNSPTSVTKSDLATFLTSLGLLSRIPVSWERISEFFFDAGSATDPSIHDQFSPHARRTSQWTDSAPDIPSFFEAEYYSEVISLYMKTQISMEIEKARRLEPRDLSRPKLLPLLTLVCPTPQRPKKKQKVEGKWNAGLFTKVRNRCFFFDSPKGNGVIFFAAG